jgi:hypothetical protein
MQSAFHSRRKLKPLDDAPRPSSAKANMQSHPCYQASLFYDNQRAAGSIQQWKERLGKERANTQIDLKQEIKRDYQLENVIWTQSVSCLYLHDCLFIILKLILNIKVKQPRRMTLTNTNDITDWEITLLKRQKSYAVAALGDLKGKVRYYLTIN